MSISSSLGEVDRAGASRARRKRQPRRTVAFEGFGILEDRSTFPLSVVNLSYDGCKIRTEIGLFPSLRFKISLLGFAGAIDAEVRWHKDREAGILFRGKYPQKRELTPRSHERLAVTAEVLLRRMGRKAYRATLLDLTSRGCKVEFIERPREGELIWVKFDGLDAIEASVRWVDGFYGGLQLVRPMHEAIFDSLLARLRP